MTFAINEHYQVLEHSGDLAILAWGDDFVSALSHASLSLVDQVVPLEGIAGVERVEFVVMDEDEGRRVVSLLNEIIYLMNVRRWLPCRVIRMTQCQGKGCSELQVILAGESADPARHAFKYDVKAATFHNLDIRREEGRVTIRFVCDL